MSNVIASLPLLVLRKDGGPHGGSGGGSDDSNSTGVASAPPQSASQSLISSPWAIALLSGAGVFLLAVIIWLSYLLLKPRRKFTALVEEDGHHAPPPTEWTGKPAAAVSEPYTGFPARGIARTPVFQAPPRRPPRTASTDYAFTAPGATGFSPPVLPFARAPGARHGRGLSRDERQILAAHTAAGTIPRPFAPLGAGHGPASSFGGSTISRPSSFAFSRVLSHVRAQPFSIGSTVDLRGRTSISSSASSFSFASLPHRGERASAAPQPAAARVQPGSHVARAAFIPLLPDEIELAPGDHTTVVDTYNDGWCVVIRAGGVADGAVHMGAVPAWVFVDGPAGAGGRPERNSSLGVTVAVPELPDLTEPDAAPSPPGTPHGSSRRSDLTSFSWSNF